MLSNVIYELSGSKSVISISVYKLTSMLLNSLLLLSIVCADIATGLLLYYTINKKKLQLT